MKRLPKFRAALAVLGAAGLLGLAPLATAQTGAAISSRPGERTPRALPEPAAEGMRLSLEQAVSLAIANNEDLNVSVNSAEASRYLLLSNWGIFDPLAQASLIRAHSESPAASDLVGAEVSTRDSTNFSTQVTQLAPTGGTFSLGLTVARTSQNSSFFFVNPAYDSGLTFSFSQPLLRNFGTRATNIRIDTSRNTRDAAALVEVTTRMSKVFSLELRRLMDHTPSLLGKISPRG